MPINLPGRFKDRYDAARRLLPELASLAAVGASMGRTSSTGPKRAVRKSGGERVDRQGSNDVVVVAIPGGGVQIGAFLARELGRPLDVALVEAAGGVTVPTSVSGKTVLLVNDGIATGLATVATVSALRRLGAARVIVAAPVASVEAVAKLENVADKVVVLRRESPFYAVGLYYENFPQVEDSEAVRLLEESR